MNCQLHPMQIVVVRFFARLWNNETSSFHRTRGTRADLVHCADGGVSGTNITRPSNYVAQATFTLPTTPGSYAVELIFNGPQMRTFGLNNAFQVQ